MRILIKSLFCVAIFVLTACSTAPVGSGKATDVGVWEGRAQVVNKTTGNKKWVYVTWASDSPNQRMRVDARAIMDVPVASFLKRNNDTQLWLFLEGAHYSSTNAERLFTKLIRFPLDPDLFFSFLGKPKELGRDWNCRDAKGKQRCVSSLHKATVLINYLDLDRREIDILKGSKSLKLRLQRSKVQVQDKLFKPLSSSQFKKFKI